MKKQVPKLAEEVANPQLLELFRLHVLFKRAGHLRELQLSDETSFCIMTI